MVLVGAEFSKHYKKLKEQDEAEKRRANPKKRRANPISKITDDDIEKISDDILLKYLKLFYDERQLRKLKEVF